MADDKNITAWCWYERADEFNGYQGQWRFSTERPSNSVARNGMQQLVTKNDQRYEILKEAGDALIEAKEFEAYEVIYKMMEATKSGVVNQKFHKGQTVFCEAIGGGKRPLTIARSDAVHDTFVYRVSDEYGWYSVLERELSKQPRWDP